MPVQTDRSLRLPESEYFAERRPKSGIALHHTVCSSAGTTLDIWRRDTAGDGTPRRVATAFVIDRDGTIYEAFDPACWAWQFGLRGWSTPDRVAFEQRFIGIEIASEGGLTEHDGRLYAYGRIAPVFEKPPAEALDCGAPWRGYRWFDRYEPEQFTALGRLVDDLCARFAIPRVYPAPPDRCYGAALARFAGVIGHAMVRADKSDPAPDPALWATLERMAGLDPVAVPTSGSSAAVASADSSASGADGTAAAPVDPAALFAANARRLDRMDVAAGSLVKALLMELERRDVYLALATPAPDAHAVDYAVVRGDPQRVASIARALGFERVTDRRLEVRRA
jgi:hypothetical protein